MSKYRALEIFFKNKEGSNVKLSFREIEQIIGDKLPQSSYKYQAWWANGGHDHAQSWLSSNWKVENIKFGEWVEFSKI